jgi:hypothetical protein
MKKRTLALSLTMLALAGASAFGWSTIRHGSSAPRQSVR